jgi:hypothetical protein
LKKSNPHVEWATDSLNDRDNSFNGKQKSIRRVADLERNDINLPNFRLDYEKNTDDLLRQLKDDLKTKL